jgi:hypothetical protein
MFKVIHHTNGGFSVVKDYQFATPTSDSQKPPYQPVYDEAGAWYTPKTIQGGPSVEECGSILTSVQEDSDDGSEYCDSPQVIIGKINVLLNALSRSLEHGEPSR